MSFLDSDKNPNASSSDKNPNPTSGPEVSEDSDPVVDPPIFRDLYCSLEDLYNGVHKKMRVTRKTMTENGGITTREKVIEFDVKRGWKAGMKVTFKQLEWREGVKCSLGDERPGHIPADIVFVVKEKPHAVYQREGNDLVFVKEVSLREALCGVRFEYQHINGRVMNVLGPAVISPDTEQVYHGLGMPISRSESDFGNLVIRFHVRFPKSISPKNKDLVRSLTFLDDE